MRKLLWLVPIGIMTLAGSAHGQTTATGFATIEVGTHWQDAAEPVPVRFSGGLVEEDRKTHTLEGFLIGAGIGLVAGYLMYNALCEAVDNRCGDSRVRLLVFGGGLGGAIGGLIGSFAE